MKLPVNTRDLSSKVDGRFYWRKSIAT